jgi:protein tyrosine/serine phosphatase
MVKFTDRRTVIARFLVIVALVVGTHVSWCAASNEPSEEQRGLPNFGQVTANLYRGGQPTPEGFNALHTMGVGIVVNFREDHAEATAEEQLVKSLGMKYVEIPWSANHDPSSAQVVEFLDLVRTNPNTKIFVHCRRGADRTGTMIASYRIAVEHKSVAEAVSEMRQYHYDWLFRSQLKRYVESLPGLLQNDPQFANYRPQSSGTK